MYSFAIKKDIRLGLKGVISCASLDTKSLFCSDNHYPANFMLNLFFALFLLPFYIRRSQSLQIVSLFLSSTLLHLVTCLIPYYLGDITSVLLSSTNCSLQPLDCRVLPERVVSAIFVFSMVRLTKVEVLDVRFPTSLHLDGSDAMVRVLCTAQVIGLQKRIVYRRLLVWPKYVNAHSICTLCKEKRFFLKELLIWYPVLFQQTFLLRMA